MRSSTKHNFFDTEHPVYVPLPTHPNTTMGLFLNAQRKAIASTSAVVAQHIGHVGFLPSTNRHDHLEAVAVGLSALERLVGNER